MMRFKTVLVSAFALSLAFAGQALAHAHLESAIPAADSTVSSPKDIQMTFTEELEVMKSSAMIMTPGGGMIETGSPELSADGKTITIPLKSTLAAGNYDVSWKVLSTDGHKTNGEYKFTVK